MTYVFLLVDSLKVGNHKLPFLILVTQVLYSSFMNEQFFLIMNRCLSTLNGSFLLCIRLLLIFSLMMKFENNSMVYDRIVPP